MQPAPMYGCPLGELQTLRNGKPTKKRSQRELPKIIVARGERMKLQRQLGEIERLIQDRRRVSAESDRTNQFEKQAEQIRAQLNELKD
jgi:hypothetical protein